MKECVILAGGVGVRLQSILKEVPKSMAIIAEKPFLFYLLKNLEKNNFTHVVLSLGYKSDTIISWIRSQNFSFDLSYVIEDKPLGTGGAIKLAIDKIKSNRFFVINGDTYFDVDFKEIIYFHKEKNAEISIALKYMTDFSRYGTVQLDTNERVVSFKEKQPMEKGLINGGLYLINKEIFRVLSSEEEFSFEKDILEKHYKDNNFYGLVQDAYFIDIGIPEDYEKADSDFKRFDVC